jgi:hypothetical protein
MYVKSLVATALVALSGAAAAQSAVLYTTRSTSATNQWVTVGALDSVSPEEVQLNVPVAGVLTPSLAFATQQSWCETIGDHDGDGAYWESPLFGAIDAIVPARMPNGALLPPSARQLFVSPANDLAHVGLGWTFHRGDLGRILPGGQLELMISETLIKVAYGIPAANRVNVDAATLSFDPVVGGLYLSFEADETVDFGAGPFTLRDGAITRIPLNMMGIGASPYDLATLVFGVAPMSAVGVFSEAQVDAMVAASNVADDAGAAVATIGDTDGIAFDAGGALLFTGENLRGGAILTPAGGGSIAVINGRSMGRVVPNPNDGQHVGLLPTATSLGALAVVPAATWSLTTDSLTGACAGCVAQFEVGGAPAGGPAWLLVNVAPDVVGPADPSASFFGWVGNPELYPFALALPIAIGADGCGGASAPLPAVAGWHMTAQSVSVNGAGVPALGTPMVIDL